MEMVGWTFLYILIAMTKNLVMKFLKKHQVLELTFDNDDEH